MTADDTRSYSQKELLEALEGRRGEIESIAGVVGTAIGLQSRDAPSDRLSIEVLISTAADADRIAEKAAALLPDMPITIVISGDIRLD